MSLWRSLPEPEDVPTEALEALQRASDGLARATELEVKGKSVATRIRQMNEANHVVVAWRQLIGT